MSQSRKFKEAIKTGLAFALVFGIAMKAGWMNPAWAGWAVAVVAMPTAGESIQKGLLRVVGTIPGCLAALAIHALAPQQRWLFLGLTCAWVFGTVYLMLSRKRYSYFWTMSCYVCLIILLSDLDSSNNMFQSAVFRTVETSMGVMVYTLIAVFLWPQTNLGAIRKAGSDLTATLDAIYRAGRGLVFGRPVPGTDFPSLQGKVVQQLNRFDQVLRAGGSESYEVKEVRPLWERFDQVSAALLDLQGRLHSSSDELGRVDLPAVIPGLPMFFAELDARFEAVRQAFTGKVVGFRPTFAELKLDSDAFERLSPFDRAAVAVARKDLEKFETLTATWLACTLEATGQVEVDRATRNPAPSEADRSSWFFMPDWDHIRGAAFVTATTAVGFLIWILWNPPGHSLWFQLSGTIALMVAIYPQLRASQLIVPVAVSSAICLGIYVFIMPQLSGFVALGTLLFMAMFLNCVLFTGMARFFFSMAILNMLPIQNQQFYSFAAMANVYIGIVGCFGLMYVMSYLLGSPRPEKVVISLIDRFFRSAEFLMSRQTNDPRRMSSFLRWRIAFHQRQLRSLPAKIQSWTKSIDGKACPGNTPEQIQNLVTSLQTLVYRIEQFQEVGAMDGCKTVEDEIREDITTWHTGIETIFGRWAQHPEADTVPALKARLDAAQSLFEERTVELVNRPGREIDRNLAEEFFCLIGGHRGVSEAAVGYAGAAQSINWSEWREERFS